MQNSIDTFAVFSKWHVCRSKLTRFFLCFFYRRVTELMNIDQRQLTLPVFISLGKWISTIPFYAMWTLSHFLLLKSLIELSSFEHLITPFLATLQALTNKPWFPFAEGLWGHDCGQCWSWVYIQREICFSLEKSGNPNLTDFFQFTIFLYTVLSHYFSKTLYCYFPVSNLN